MYQRARYKWYEKKPESIQLVAETIPEEIKRAHEDFMQRSKLRPRDFADIEAQQYRVQHSEELHGRGLELQSSKLDVKEGSIIGEAELQQHWRTQPDVPRGKWTQ